MIGRVFDNRDKTKREERYIALDFEGGPKAARKIIKVLKRKFGAKASLWNIPRLCGAFFLDDYFLRFYIKEKPFDIQNLGFTWMDGLALVTEPENTEEFFRILETLKAELHLQVIKT